jgi:hypothetical protein
MAGTEGKHPSFGVDFPDVKYCAAPGLRRANRGTLVGASTESLAGQGSDDADGSCNSEAHDVFVPSRKSGFWA